MRLECGFRAAVELTGGRGHRRSRFSDGSYPERIGWREIVASGDGVEIDAESLPRHESESAADRLPGGPPDPAARHPRGDDPGDAGRRRRLAGSDFRAGRAR